VDPITQLITAITELVRSQVFVPLMILALIICGLIFMLGKHEAAQSKATWVLVGGAIILGAPRVVTWLQGVVK
jgi:type IV secretory pathway VirB2 component (pilin)